MCLVLSPGVAQAQIGEDSCKPIKFLNVTPDAFECMKTKLQDYGIEVQPGNEGELSGSGVTAEFEWDGRSELTITVKKRPPLVSCETADERLILFVDECKGP
jgi:hypothetical protein